MRRKRWVIVVLLSVALAAACFIFSYVSFADTQRRVTDPAFIMLEDIPSTNKKHRLLIYHYDTGAFGYSRAWWAVTPDQYQDLNLTDYELPDGYLAKGWSKEDELLIEKWEPYYYRQKLGELKTGDFYKGVRVRRVK